MDKRANKKSKEELQQYLMWRRRGKRFTKTAKTTTIFKKSA